MASSDPDVVHEERPSGMKLSLDMELTAFPDFPPLQNDLILRAACKLPTERVPIWVMRQVLSPCMHGLFFLFFNYSAMR